MDKKVFNLSSRIELGKYIKLLLDIFKNVLILIYVIFIVLIYEKEYEGLFFLVGKRIRYKFMDGVYKGFVIFFVLGFL